MTTFLVQNAADLANFSCSNPVVMTGLRLQGPRTLPLCVVNPVLWALEVEIIERM